MTLYRITHKPSGMTYVGVGSNGETLADCFRKLSTKERLCPSLYHDIQAFGESEFETKQITTSSSGIEIANAEDKAIKEYGPMAYNQDPIMKEFYNL